MPVGKYTTALIMYAYLAFAVANFGHGLYRGITGNWEEGEITPHAQMIASCAACVAPLAGYAFYVSRRKK